MRFFFRSKRFKIILIVAAVVIAVSALCALLGGTIAPQANLAGAISAPFRSLVKGISNGISDLAQGYADNNKLLLKNAELEAENARLREQLVEYDQAIYENAFFKDYLEIKDKNPDFQFVDAALVSTNAEDPFAGFVINKGSLAGVSQYDPVITDKGLVGYITQVGLATSKVTTVLSSDLTLGALDNRTHESGVISGEIDFAKEGCCRFYNISRTSSIAVGDYVVTSGEGIFPNGLLVGNIESIGSDRYNTSIYAKVRPFVDFGEIRSVMVITDFEGKGGVKVSEK